MEFVVVTFDGPSRAVFVDQQNQGVTGVRLSIPQGSHVFDLGLPVDYDPPFQEVDVQNTTPTEPMPIAFLSALAEARVPTARRARAKRKKAKRPAKRTRRAAKQKPRRAKSKSRASKPKRRTRKPK
jgi:hypothetical protein